MAISCDYVLTDILKTLPSIPFALLSVQSITNKNESYVLKIYCDWVYQINLYSEKAVHIKDLGAFSSDKESKAMITKFLEQMKLQIEEAIIIYDADYQIINAYHFNLFGNVEYTFNSIRYSTDEIAVEFDLFSNELNDKECLKDYQIFVSSIKKETCAQRVILQQPGLLEVIRKKKLERIISEQP